MRFNQMVKVPLVLVVSGIIGLLLFGVPEDPASAQAKGAPKMVLKEQLIVLKDVVEGKDVTHSFDVFNQGDEPLRIEQVKPDCSCSVVSFDTTILPQGRGEIKVKVDTKGFNGPERWGFKVSTNDPKWKEAVLDIRANIKPVLILSGKAIYFTGKDDLAATKEIEINAGIDRTLIISPQQFTLSGKVDYSIAEIEKGKRYRVTFTSVPGTSKSYRGFLSLKTNFPEKPELTLWIIGRFSR